MRALCLLLALTTPLAGCGPGTDPALGACATRKPAQMTLGTGADQFEPIKDTIVVQLGPPGQGGGSMHIWFAMRFQNMGPHVLASMGVDDVATGQSFSPLALRQAIDLEYNPDAHTDDVYGIRCFVETENDYTYLLGRQLRLWVKVDDDCKAHQEAEAVTTVSGFHQL